MWQGKNQRSVQLIQQNESMSEMIEHIISFRAQKSNF